MICQVVGARPNFVKMAPVVRESRRRGLDQFLVHTGQHYDAQMSEVFFEELGMPRPDLDLGVGSGSHAEQTARVMLEFEKVLAVRRPRLVVVAGDVNSTLACALVAAKVGIPVAHVESGLRSFDREMPEEVNRVLTDHLADLLFVTEPAGLENLRREGIEAGKVQFVGNTMIDSLLEHRERALARAPWKALDLEEGGYGLVTLHRPSNVDGPERAGEIGRGLAAVARKLPLLFPIHPRTRARSAAAFEGIEGLRLVEPLGYLDFLALMARAQVDLTDSGGIQEETTALGVPCVTLRKNTERPITVSDGTNRLVALEATAIAEAALTHRPQSAKVPAMWDGKAAIRVAALIEGLLD